ncbi:MAG: P-loop NTPase [Phycisphaerae bacterium]
MVRTPTRGELVVVASGKGGVGKTNLALNLGIQLSRHGARTILLDADFGHANVDILLNISPRADLADLRKPVRSVQKLLTDGPAGLRVLCGISGLRHEPGVCKSDPALYVEALGRLGRACDVLIVDCGAGATGAAASFALACDRLILVTTPEPAAVADSYATLKLLYQRGFCARAAVVVNMTQQQAEAIDTVRRLQRVAVQFLGLSLEYLGYVPFDRHVIAAVRQREPFVMRYPRCAASVRTDAISRRLRPSARTARMPVGLWGRVASLFF